MRLILHAGTHKTGTTSIQHFAHDNRDALLQRGLYYLSGKTSLGGKTKTWRSNNWVAHSLTGAYPEGEERFRQALDMARAAAAEGAAVLVSSEDLSSCCRGHQLWGGLDREDYRELQRAYLENLARLLDGFDVEVVLVFRRADEYAESLYQTVVKSNRFSGDFEAFLRYHRPVFEYARQIEQFETVFGAVTLASYHDLVPNVVEGFMDKIGFSVTDSSDYRRNTSVDARLIYWKALRDIECGNDDKDRALHRRFILSEEAGPIFETAEKASFWRSVEEREAFHEKTAAGLDSIAFPPAKAATGTDARLSGTDYAMVTARFEAWKAGQKKTWVQKILGKFG